MGLLSWYRMVLFCACGMSVFERSWALAFSSIMLLFSKMIVLDEWSCWRSTLIESHRNNQWMKRPGKIRKRSNRLKRCLMQLMSTYFKKTVCFWITFSLRLFSLWMWEERIPELWWLSFFNLKSFKFHWQIQMGNKERRGQTMVMFSCFVFSLIACLPFFSDHLSKGTQLFVEWLLRKVYLWVMGEKFHKTKKAFPAKASWLAILCQVLLKKKKRKKKVHEYIYNCIDFSFPH